MREIFFKNSLSGNMSNENFISAYCTIHKMVSLIFSFRYFATVLSNLVVFFVCFVLFELNGENTENKDLESSLSRIDANKFFVSLKLCSLITILGRMF